MLNVCLGCGEYRADKTIDPEGPFAVCPICQHKHPFRQLPLLVVCGPSGSGKTTVCNGMVGVIEEAVVLDADILWRPEFNKPGDNFRAFYETWLRLGKNIGQAGRPLVLVNAGAVPSNIEPCVERRYFSKVHYLALICEDEVLGARLRQRPAWRQSRDESFIEGQIEYSHALKEMASEADPQVELLDTSHATVDATVGQVTQWIRGRV